MKRTAADGVQTELRSYTRSEIFPEPSFPLRAMTVIHPASFAAHTHEFVEMVCVVSGQGIHKLKRAGSSKTLSCGILFGDIFLLRPGDTHSFLSCSDLKLYNIMFMPEMAAEFADELGKMPGLEALYGDPGKAALKLRFEPAQKAAFEALARKMLLEFDSKPQGYRLAARLALFEMLLLAGRAAKAGVKDEAAKRNGGEKLFRQQMVNRAICLMEANLESGISVESLASKLRISPSHLSRCFKELCGLPPCEYMMRLRLEKAKAMLLESDLPVASIAFQNGFCDASYMSKLFRQLEGCSPNEFRRKIRA